jgi:hypothetical protein
MRKIRRYLGIVLVAGILPITPYGNANQPGSGAATGGPFRVSGNQILDPSGNAVRFRGVDTGMLNWYPYIDTSNTQDVSDASFDAMRRWGVNAVRIPLGEQYWFQSRGCKYPITPSRYHANVATIVNRITSRGMLAILDLHWNTKVDTGLCNASQQPMADSAESVKLWSEVAAIFKDNPMVAFDLYNEPHDISWQIWKYGGRVMDPSGFVWNAAGMQQMYNAVRGAGAGNLVFITGNDWGNMPPTDDDLISGYNIVYAAHYYTCPTPPVSECQPNPNEPFPVNDPAPPGYRLDRWTPLAGTNAVAVTEFGWPDQNDGTYNGRVISWAESRGVHWMAFTWNPNKPFGLITDLSSYNPQPSGVPVKNGVALNVN